MENSVLHDLEKGLIEEIGFSSWYKNSQFMIFLWKEQYYSVVIEDNQNKWIDYNSIELINKEDIKKYIEGYE